MPELATRDALALGLVVLCLVGSIVSNSIYGRSIGDTSCQFLTKFSPSSGAFGIWIAIYSLSVAMVGEQLYSFYTNNVPPVRLETNVLHASAWACAALWTPLFASQRTAGIVAAAFALFACFALSASAVFFEAVWRTTSYEPRRWITGAALAMLAGWTAVAAPLNAAIASKALRSDESLNCASYPQAYTILDALDSTASTPVPLLLSLGGLAAATLLPDVFLPVPIIWAVFFMRPSTLNYVAFVSAWIALVGAVVGAYTNVPF